MGGGWARESGRALRSEEGAGEEEGARARRRAARTHRRLHLGLQRRAEGQPAPQAHARGAHPPRARGVALEEGNRRGRVRVVRGQLLVLFARVAARRVLGRVIQNGARGQQLVVHLRHQHDKAVARKNAGGALYGPRHLEDLAVQDDARKALPILNDTCLVRVCAAFPGLLVVRVLVLGARWFYCRGRAILALERRLGAKNVAAH